MGDGKAHATLSASGADTWMRCAGSVQMCRGLENRSSSYADEGTAAHALAEACLRKGYSADQLIGETFEGYEATLEMAQYVQEYLDFVLSFKGNLLIEQCVDYSKWTSKTDGFGTVDATILNDGTVHVIDFKYGQNEFCDARTAYQPMMYGLGVLNDFGMLFDIKKFELAIVQPRMDSITERSISLDEMIAWGEKVKTAAEATEAENPPLVPGEKQCRWCDAKHVCPARAEQFLGAINEGFESIESPGKRRKVSTLTGEQIGAIIPLVKGFDSWVKGVKARGAELLELGETVTDHKLVLSSPHRQWVDEEKVGKYLSKKLGKKTAYPEKLISPSQAETLLGKDTKYIKDHTFKPEGKPTIAHESDKREAISTNIADGFDVIDEAA